MYHGWLVEDCSTKTVQKYTLYSEVYTSKYSIPSLRYVLYVCTPYSVDTGLFHGPSLSSPPSQAPSVDWLVSSFFRLRPISPSPLNHSTPLQTALAFNLVVAGPKILRSERIYAIPFYMAPSATVPHGWWRLLVCPLAREGVFSWSIYGNMVTRHRVL